MSNKETQISVTVHGLQDGDQVFFRINRGSGGRLRAEQTPNDLEMEEGDDIYANRVETKPPSRITLKVRDIDGNVDVFKIMRSAQLKKLMDSYCERRSVDCDSFVFRFNGRLLRGPQTPEELGMKESDEIYAMLNYQSHC